MLLKEFVTPIKMNKNSYSVLESPLKSLLRLLLPNSFSSKYPKKLISVLVKVPVLSKPKYSNLDASFNF